MYNIIIVNKEEGNKMTDTRYTSEQLFDALKLYNGIKKAPREDQRILTMVAKAFIDGATLRELMNYCPCKVQKRNY